MKTTENKAAFARELGIARSSLYYTPKKEIEDGIIRQKILEVQEEHPAYGHRRIAIALKLNKKRIRRIMHTYHIRPRLLRRKPTKQGDIGNIPSKTPNRAKTICPIRPNALWSGDFTYIPWQGGFIYVATVIDVYTRELIGWSIGSRHTADLVMKALEDALLRTKASPEIFHSDQGSEYLSEAYEQLLKKHGIMPSHAKKSSPWENGHQESFYKGFKLELGNPIRFNHVGELIEAIHAQICYYNKRRIHTALKMPPMLFHLQFIQRQQQVIMTA